MLRLLLHSASGTAMRSRCLLLLLALLFGTGAPPAAAQFDLRGGLDTTAVRLTTFAEGLNYPVGMAALPDGSVLVAVSTGPSFFGSSAGQLLRLIDDDGDGRVDRQEVLADVPVGRLSSVRRASDLVVVTGQRTPIMFYRLTAEPAYALAEVGRLTIDYGGSWLHPHSTLAVRLAPDEAGRYDVVFPVGSAENFAAATRTLPFTSTFGLDGTLAGDALHRLQVTLGDDGLTDGTITQLATGLRSAAGLAFHPAAGDLYLQDNGIDGLEDANEPHSADELNVIPASEIGGAIEDFGFPENYTAYRTGTFVGGEGRPPLVAFQPIPDPETGAESEGANDIAFAPPGFPEGFNTGLFVGFHGRFFGGGVANEENPLVYVDLDVGTYVHVVGVDEPGVGHLDGLLATDSSLFVADMAPSGSLREDGRGTGVIYQFRARPARTTAREAGVASRAAALEGVYPSPTNGPVRLRMALTRPVDIDLAVYDLLGRRLATLRQGRQAAGTHVVRWDGRDERGVSVAAGLYFVRLFVPEGVQVQRVVVR